MGTLAIVVLVALLLPGCGKSKPTNQLIGKSGPTYQLIIGKNVIDLPVHDDPKLIQDDIIANIKPLWDNLDSGNSATFYFERTTPLDLGHPRKDELKELDKHIEKQAGGNAEYTLTSKCTKSGPRLRFFTNRDGINGIEMLGTDNKEPWACLSGKLVDWNRVESELRGQLYGLERIRVVLQHEWGKQSEPPK